MRKKMAIACIVVMMAVLTACGGSDKSIDVEKLSAELLEKVSFTDELTKADAGTIARIYGIESASEAEVYIGSGATAEEIGIFAFKEESEAEGAFEKVKQRLQSQKDSYESYAPEELKRLDNAFLKKEGRYVIFCVSDGEEADQIINEYLK